MKLSLPIEIALHNQHYNNEKLKRVLEEKSATVNWSSAWDNRTPLEVTYEIYHDGNLSIIKYAKTITDNIFRYHFFGGDEQIVKQTIKIIRTGMRGDQAEHLEVIIKEAGNYEPFSIESVNSTKICFFIPIKPFSYQAINKEREQSIIACYNNAIKELTCKHGLYEVFMEFGFSCNKYKHTIWRTLMPDLENCCLGVFRELKDFNTTTIESLKIQKVNAKTDYILLGIR